MSDGKGTNITASFLPISLVCKVNSENAKREQSSYMSINDTHTHTIEPLSVCKGSVCPFE